VEIVIDLIRQRCQWQETAYTESYTTAKFVLRIIQVSDTDLFTEVLKHVPDLINRLHIIISKAYLALRLRHVSTVTHGDQYALEPIRPGRMEYSTPEFEKDSANGLFLHFELSKATPFVPSAQVDEVQSQRLKNLASLLRYARVTDWQRTFQRGAAGQEQARLCLGWIQIYQSDEPWNGQALGMSSMIWSPQWSRRVTDCIRILSLEPMAGLGSKRAQ
jgi:hypothetical protein